MNIALTLLCISMRPYKNGMLLTLEVVLDKGMTAKISFGVYSVRDIM